jgi:hypothetical protein
MVGALQVVEGVRVEPDPLRRGIVDVDPGAAGMRPTGLGSLHAPTVALRDALAVTPDG